MGGGNPAKLLRKRFNDETIEELQKISWWDWNDELINMKAQLFSNPSDLIQSMKG